MRWIALTGGIGSGKTTVAKLFQGRGVPVIDADILAKEVVAKSSPGLQQVITAFGPEFLTAQGELDRAKMSAHVFKNSGNLQQLESILHPLIQKRTAELRAQAEKDGHEFAIYDIPLLFEKKMEDRFDGIVLVWAPAELQLKRLQARNGMSLEDAKLRLKAQIPIDDKKSKSTWVLDNSGDLKFLDQQFEQVFRAITSAAKR